MNRSKTNKKVAVLLCGSGFKDGSEIRESVATLLALSQCGAQYQCFAPDALQHHVVNCLTGEPAVGEARNMLVEAARIARGSVRAITELKVSNYDALMIPGGFGVAKNLCDFASQGSGGHARLDVADVIQAFHQARKPIGAICIAPALVALTLRGAALELTLGETCEASQEIEKLGHKHIVMSVTECHVDRKNFFVTTPAYMIDDAPIHEVFSGIEKCVSAVINLTDL
ncbi:MAG: isoprenoid biosynthesis glyoxalase ElbB [Xanthomonadaceae bacterium]|nr:isoprenoid biosynthesis glyoxalase ElbB [Xanthomonadaceae bacterium]